MHNLTARYNYLYNARAIINEEKQILVDSHIGNATEQLDQVIYKVGRVITEKRHSKYIPEAYLLLAEAHYLQGNYFLAEAYFSYVSQTYGSNIGLHIKGLDGSARSLMQRDKQGEAAPLLDSLKRKLPLINKHRAGPLVTLAQSRIAVKDYNAAIVYLEAALKEKSTPQQRNCWYNSLSQLYHAENDYPKAVFYARKAEKRRENAINRPLIPDTAVLQSELKDPEGTANANDLSKLKFNEHENLLGKNFNTVAGNHRKSKYFTYVQQSLSPEITLQKVLLETPLKALPLPAENEYNPVNAAKKAAVPDSIFQVTPSNSYYFVIVVNDASTNLSSSRFGIGEFNRGNFAGQGLKHRLTEFDNDQLIYIGNFSNFETVKKYADRIGPQLEHIMKVPAGSYHSFISSEDNFEKIKSKYYLNKYLEFYKNNF
ncbi:tetratricopeptide repeat protein [Pedobacter immunditicola]|uniref:tetratricopeptide repeat protein n=1 Tax=Pedobacter immunditicola TaxID=3133440 RepID=UPI0030B4C408